MPWKEASKIELSKKEEKILEEKANGTHKAEHIKMRAGIILKASEGKSNNAIETEMNIQGNTVKKWRDRYRGEYEELRRVEAEKPDKMWGKIEKILADEQRSGSPAKFTDEEVAAIIALGCEDPARLGLPFSHWSPRLLQIETINRGIVESISVRQVGRFFKRTRFEAP